MCGSFIFIRSAGIRHSADLKLTSSSRVLKISENEFACQGKTSRSRYFSLYVKGRSEKDFLNICNAFLEKKRASVLQLFQLIVQPAYASDSICSAQSMFIKNISNLKNNLDQSLISQKLGTCISETLQGAGGVFSGFADGFKSLLKSPSGLWQELSAQAQNFLDFITHLKSEVLQIANGFPDLDADLIASLACHLGGEILTSASLSVAGGIGTAKLSLILAQALLKLKNMKGIFSRLNQLMQTGKPHLAKEILNCDK